MFIGLSACVWLVGLVSYAAWLMLGFGGGGAWFLEFAFVGLLFDCAFWCCLLGLVWFVWCCLCCGFVVCLFWLMWFLGCDEWVYLSWGLVLVGNLVFTLSVCLFLLFRVCLCLILFNSVVHLLFCF